MPRKPAAKPTPPTALPSGFRLTASEPVLIKQRAFYLSTAWQGRPVALTADETWGERLGKRWGLERVK
jgi:hypothetical protein